jgi:hypothetical protein
VPGVDPTHVHRTLRTGLLRAQCEGVAQAQFFRNREGGDVTQFGVAVHLGAAAGQHASDVLDVFHCAHQVAEVGAVRLETADMDDVGVGEFLRHHLRCVHEAKRGREDDVEALARQRANHLLGVGAFRHILDIGGVDILQVGLDVLATDVVGLRPSAIVVRANIDEGNVVLALFDVRNLHGACAIRRRCSFPAGSGFRRCGWR